MDTRSVTRLARRHGLARKITVVFPVSNGKIVRPSLVWWYQLRYRTKRISTHLRAPQAALESRALIGRPAARDLITRRSPVRIRPPL